MHAVLAIGAVDRTRITPRDDWAGYVLAEVIHAVTAEGARTLADPGS